MVSFSVPGHLPVLSAKDLCIVPSSGILHSGLPMLLALAEFHGFGMELIFFTFGRNRGPGLSPNHRNG